MAANWSSEASRDRHLIQRFHLLNQKFTFLWLQQSDSLLINNQLITLIRNTDKMTDPPKDNDTSIPSNARSDTAPSFEHDREMTQRLFHLHFQVLTNQPSNILPPQQPPVPSLRMPVSSPTNQERLTPGSSPRIRRSNARMCHIPHMFMANHRSRKRTLCEILEEAVIICEETISLSAQPTTPTASDDKAVSRPKDVITDANDSKADDIPDTTMPNTE